MPKKTKAQVANSFAARSKIATQQGDNLLSTDNNNPKREDHIRVALEGHLRQCQRERGDEVGYKCLEKSRQTQFDIYVKAGIDRTVTSMHTLKDFISLLVNCR